MISGGVISLVLRQINDLISLSMPGHVLQTLSNRQITIMDRQTHQEQIASHKNDNSIRMKQSFNTRWDDLMDYFMESDKT